MPEIDVSLQLLVACAALELGIARFRWSRCVTEVWVNEVEVSLFTVVYRAQCYARMHNAVGIGDGEMWFSAKLNSRFL